MKYLLTIPAFLFACTCSAQQKQYVFLLKNNGDHVRTKDSMDYIRVVKEPAEGSKLYDVAEYYPSGKPKSAGHSSGIDPVILEGAYTTYWPNGATKTTAVYKHNKIYGDVSDFFSNGRLHSVITYGKPDSVKKGEPIPDEAKYIKTCNDSTGKTLTINGNGYFTDYDNPEVSEEGMVKNGNRTGEWKGDNKKEQFTFTETYDDIGKLISGTSKDSAGVYTYTQRYVNAQPKGGSNAFYKNYLNHIIKYPVMARRNDIQGIEIVRALITVDGKLTGFQILQSLSPDIDQECIRVLNLSPLWQPATAFGRSITAINDIPISFTMVNK